MRVYDPVRDSRPQPDLIPIEQCAVCGVPGVERPSIVIKSLARTDPRQDHIALGAIINGCDCGAW